MTEIVGTDGEFTTERDRVPDPQHHRHPLQPDHRDAAASRCSTWRRTPSSSPSSCTSGSRRWSPNTGSSCRPSTSRTSRCPPRSRRRSTSAPRPASPATSRKYTDFSAAEAMTKAAANPGGGGGIGAGLGVGMGMAMAERMARAAAPGAPRRPAPPAAGPAPRPPPPPGPGKRWHVAGRRPGDRPLQPRRARAHGLGGQRSPPTPSSGRRAGRTGSAAAT